MVEITELSQQSSKQSSPSYVYDVFLSFRGDDTRNNFTNHLHKALVDATIDTFLDDAEIQTGEELKPELESAIKASRASIIVLSKDYASSRWCLDELVLILEQRRNFNKIVIPIFYHVEPTDVRKQQNNFADAMATYEQRMDTESDADKKSQWAQKIGQWKKALTEVADLKGKDAHGRLETILIEETIKEISSRLELHKRSSIPHMIGMKSYIDTIEIFLKDDSAHNTQVLTLWGMAGIGKTYLADYIFKLHYFEFERSCFLEDVERRCTSSNGLLDLQKQILKDFQDGSWMDVQDTNVGTCKIEKVLHRKTTLLVLDGISKIQQLDALIGMKGLHPRSKLIITSKDRSITENCRLFGREIPPKCMRLSLKGLDWEESIQLLSWHAFGRLEPTKDDKKDSMKVAEYCNGHPLALKVLGQSVRNEDATWDDILESLSKKINHEVQEVLHISFNSLPNEKDKELFKFIACFFIGEDKVLCEEILKACGICRSSGIKNLTRRCLLTVDPETNQLKMHQLLQDLGRYVVYQESPEKPWKRSMLWHHEESITVLKQKKISGMAKQAEFERLNRKIQELENMQNLLRRIEMKLENLEISRKAQSDDTIDSVDQVFNMEYIPEPFVEEYTTPIYDTYCEEEETKAGEIYTTVAHLVSPITCDSDNKTANSFFRVLETIYYNTSQIELPIHYNKFATFIAPNLSSYVGYSGDDVDSRTSLFEERENDAVLCVYCISPYPTKLGLSSATKQAKYLIAFGPKRMRMGIG